MQRLLSLACLLVVLIGVTGCGGYGDSTPSSPSEAPPAGAIVIDILGENGDRSFSPNPSTVPAGQTVVWHNADRQDHRVVLNGGGLDTGNIPAGRYSAPMTLPQAGPYHCSIHPTMVGALVVS